MKLERVIEKRKRIKILNATIDVLTEKQTVRLVDKYIYAHEPLHLIGVNADKINMMNQDANFAQLVNGCGIINADGASVVLASKFLGKPLPERVAGIDLMDSLVKHAVVKQHSIYLLGARENVAQKAKRILLENNPGLKVAGVHNGYFKENEWPEIYNQIASAKPDIVFVGITSPVKEYLVEYFQKKGCTATFMGVGGSFDVISGLIPRAPKWMQRCNLEWLFRVMKEPRRLFKRYFVGNFRFVYSVLIEKINFRRVDRHDS